ncbi:MAG: hypothetical protein Q7T21_15555 [Gallionella sp.]|nr:hypothetical protein [Gallionella sp.]
MKVDVKILEGPMVLKSKQHIFALMWLCVGSLALLDINEEIFTLTSGGSFRVWGTPEVVAVPEAGVLMPDRLATRRDAEQFSWDDTTAGQLRVFESILASSNALRKGA